jgi:hypothetical protein
VVARSDRVTTRCFKLAQSITQPAPFVPSLSVVSEDRGDPDRSDASFEQKRHCEGDGKRAAITMLRRNFEEASSVVRVP